MPARTTAGRTCAPRTCDRAARCALCFIIAQHPGRGSVDEAARAERRSRRSKGPGGLWVGGAAGVGFPTRSGPQPRTSSAPAGWDRSSGGGHVPRTVDRARVPRRIATLSRADVRSIDSASAPAPPRESSAGARPASHRAQTIALAADPRRDSFAGGEVWPSCGRVLRSRGRMISECRPAACSPE